MGYIDHKELSIKDNKDKYANFGKYKPIPGVKRENLFLRNNTKGAEIQLFSGGIFENDGVSGCFAGLKGNIPLYDKGQLEIYGGAGNIAAAGAKFSHSVWKNNNFALKGYAKAEGAISLTDNREFITKINTDAAGTDYSETSLVTECPGEVTITDNFNAAISEELEYPTSFDGYDFNTIYHKTDFIQSYNVNMDNSNISAYLPNSDFKTAIGAEATYTNDKGNFEVGIGGELGIRSKFVPIAKYNSTFDAKLDVNLISAESSEDASAVLDAFYDSEYGSWGLDIMSPNIKTNESVDLTHTVDIGGFEAKLGLKSKLYGALKGRINYRAGKFGINAEAGINCSDKSFTPAFKAGISYQIGNSPIIHKHGARVLFRKNPLSGEHLFQDRKYPEAKLNIFAKGQSINGVSGFALGLGGNIPINNIGTELNISAGAGNIITADINLSQTNPVVNDNWALRSKLGAGLDYSFSRNDIYSASAQGYEKQSAFHVDPKNPNLGTEREYDFKETYLISLSGNSSVNSNSMKLYGGIDLCYKPSDNCEIAVGVEGGLKGNYSTSAINIAEPSTEINSVYSDKIDYDDNYHDVLLAYNHYGYRLSWWQNMSLVDYYKIDDVRIPENGFDHPGFFVGNDIVGNSQINFNSESLGKISYAPKFKPYITPTVSAEYDIKNIGKIGAKASFNGAAISFTRSIK